MPLKDLLKRKSKIEDRAPPPDSDDAAGNGFTFMRTDTNTQEIISPPSFAGDKDPPVSPKSRRASRFRSLSAATSPSPFGTTPKSEKRLSDRLHLNSQSRKSSLTSVYVPEDLPQIEDVVEDDEEKQAKWEKRATLLAKSSSTGAISDHDIPITPIYEAHARSVSKSRSRSRSIVDPEGDENIQEAIRLHEAGELARSTAMFGRLADPSGTNNALSQVLYGLALRHGWGCEPDPAKAVTYLSAAAQNSAQIEKLALDAGMKKGGAAKGELVLAIYELANCYRHGWGVKSDPVAAKQYYETAANLGDTDAMNEVALCYLNGYGTKKDKKTAARYYRLAEQSGSKTLGNSWIWKDKYNPN